MQTFSGDGFLHADLTHPVRTLHAKSAEADSGAVNISLDTSSESLRIMIVDEGNNPAEFDCQISEAEEKVALFIYAAQFALHIEGKGSFHSQPVLVPRPKRQDDDDDRRERVPA